MSPIWEGNKLMGLTLTCRVEADLLEYRYPLSDQERKELTGRLASQVENQIRGALDKLRQWQADCLGLGAQVALTSARQMAGHPGGLAQYLCRAGTRPPDQGIDPGVRKEGSL